MQGKNAFYNKKQAEVIERLREKGINVQQGKKSPRNGRYSGIVGNDRKRRVLKI
ncbi:hypothetical protein [Tenuibacillus multivorans]|uniref:Uncharacterized protein n=1 Tax=Tenuibacillus multivorans TaxID=237069 RepID=A0A1H0BUF7_9BACI|nr:hypothetical protein [Tenuibacillus multivorans]GEL77031.1 hypothetical protein TMU01_12660 [Tenuibacillus multivorans]SDN49242.1 hypothetical protein SAMN05216498_2391 [Tenuibacillus multivorans]